MMYNDIIQQVGKRIVKHIYYIDNGTTTNVNDDNVGRIELTMRSNLIGTAIKGCKINVKEELKGEIYVEVVARYQTNTATKTYGPYYIKDYEYDADIKEYTYTLYDGFVKSMVDYEQIEHTYPSSVYDYFVALLTSIGYTTNIQSLPNGARMMENDIYNDIGFTKRDIIEDIAIANGVLLYEDNNEIKKATFGNNTISIDDDILRNQNIDFGEHFGPINSIVLSRSADSDKIVQKDDESIEDNGLCEFMIRDNQLMNDNNRSDYLPALANQLFGIEYDIYDTELVGYGDIGILDEVEFETGNKTYNSYVFNDEIILTSGYKQSIYNEMPEETNTDYKKTSKTDKMIKQAYIIVDKQNGEINSFVGRVSDLSDKVKENSDDIDRLGTELSQTEQSFSIRVKGVEDVLANGVTLVKTTSVLIDNSGLNVGKSGSKISTNMSNNEFKIVDNMGNVKTFIGYDEEAQTSKSEIDNLTIPNYFVSGYHRTEKIRVNLEKRTGVFYIGG